MCFILLKFVANHHISMNLVLALKRAGCSFADENAKNVRQRLTAESVEGTSLPLQGIDDIHGGDGLPLGVLGVGDGITDDVLKENLEDTTGLFVDETADSLHTTSASQTADGGLGDTLDVITQHFAVTLGAPFAESFSSFTTSRHVEFL